MIIISHYLFFWTLQMVDIDLISRNFLHFLYLMSVLYGRGWLLGISRNVCAVHRILLMMVCLPLVVTLYNVLNIIGTVLLFESYCSCFLLFFNGSWKKVPSFYCGILLFPLPSFLCVHLLWCNLFNMNYDFSLRPHMIFFQSFGLVINLLYQFSQSFYLGSNRIAVSVH